MTRGRAGFRQGPEKIDRRGCGTFLTAMRRPRRGSPSPADAVAERPLWAAGASPRTGPATGADDEIECPHLVVHHEGSKRRRTRARVVTFRHRGLPPAARAGTGP